jgi:hypothetical protein
MSSGAADCARPHGSSRSERASALRIYSDILAYTTAVGAWVYFEVPAGRRAVIRDISSSNAGGAGQLARVTAHNRVVWLHSFSGANQFRRDELMQVVYQGGWVGIHHSLAGCTTVISGWLLDDPSGQTGTPMEPQLGAVALPAAA